jgi:hypothetical protein
MPAPRRCSISGSPAQDLVLRPGPAGPGARPGRGGVHHQARAGHRDDQEHGQRGRAVRLGGSRRSVRSAGKLREPARRPGRDTPRSAATISQARHTGQNPLQTPPDLNSPALRLGRPSPGFKSPSDTLNPHERPFTGMLHRRPRSASGRGGSFLLLLARRASFSWFWCQWSLPMVTPCASWSAACSVLSSG